MRTISCLSVAMLSLAACGGGSATTVVGTVGGISIPAIGEAKAIIQANANCTGQTDLGALVDIDIASTTGICNQLTGGVVPKSTTDLNLIIQAPHPGSGPAGTPPAIVAGVYNIGSTAADPNGFTMNVSAAIEEDDATCNAIVPSPYHATAGIITIAAISPSSVSGTFNLTFSTDGTLTGTFSAADCGETVAQVCAQLTATNSCSP